MNAAQPHTTYAVVLAAQSVVSIGQAGAWIGPLLVGGLAAALDASAIGAHAWRDRIAVCGYYAAAISFVTLLGLAGWERSMFTDYNWRMAGAVASLVTHGALLLAMFGGLIGPTRALSAEIAKKIKFGSDATAKVNQTLLGWTVAAAVTAPMAGTGGWGAVVDAIAAGTTGMWGAIVGTVMSWLGG
jgi:hypothetical protein